MMALGCYDYAKEMKLKIPKDIAIVGFDDIFSSQFLTPPLTTIKVPTADIGKFAANILMDKIEGKNHNPQNIKVPVELIIRESC